MSAIEALLIVLFVIPLSVAIIVLFLMATYLQIKGQMQSPKEDKELKFNTLSRYELGVTTSRLLKQDTKKRRAKYISRQQLMAQRVKVR